MKCDKCGQGDMVEKNGKNGAFMACTNYPNCRNTANVEAGTQAPAYPTDKIASKNTTMYTSYAKDIFIALNQPNQTETPAQMMEMAVALVQQAKVAFE